MKLTPFQKAILEIALEQYRDAIEETQFHERSMITKEYYLENIDEILKQLTKKNK